MADAPTDLKEIKRRLSPRVLRIRGVSGIGIPGGKLTVYLVEDRDAVKRKVASLIESETPGAPFECIVTGVFKPH